MYEEYVCMYVCMKNTYEEYVYMKNMYEEYV